MGWPWLQPPRFGITPAAWDDEALPASRWAVRAACVRIVPSLVLTACTPVPPARQALWNPPPKQTTRPSTNQLPQGLQPSGKPMLASALHLVSEEAGSFLHPKPACLANNQDTAEAWYTAQKMPHQRKLRTFDKRKASCNCTEWNQDIYLISYRGKRGLGF